MKHLFVVRHGDYNDGDHGNWDNNLSEKGKQQIIRIAEEMRAIVGETHNGHYLLSSTAPRAEQTAEIIARAWGLTTFAKDERLYTGGGDDLCPEELEAIDGMIAPHRDTHDIVTITTHYEVVGSYPRHVVKTLFGRDEHIRRPDKGQGVYFNLEAKTHQFIPR